MSPRKPVRVCFVIDRLSLAGTETQLLALIKNADRSRLRPHLCLLDGEDDLSREMEPADCPVLRLGIRSLTNPADLLRAGQFVRFLRDHRIDVVQTYFLDSTYLAVPLARLCGVRRVVRVRNNLGYWLTPAHRLLGRVMSQMVDATVTNCELARTALVRAERTPARRVAVLENGVDLDRFRHAPPPDATRAGVVHVGAVANLRPVKNVDLLVDAAAAVCRRHLRVVFQVAGEGDERLRLEQLVAARGLTGRFRLLGAVADVPGFLARQDVAVLCSRSESMSNALLEYMAAGRAVVSTRVGAAEELIDDGEHGLLVPPGQAAPLAAALERLVTEPGLSARLGAAARRRVEERYSRRAMCERFAGFYERLCA